MRLALIGNGAIATLITRFCDKHQDRFDLAGALALPHETVSVGKHPLLQTIDALLALKADTIVECASHSAVAEYTEKVLAADVDFIIVSVGSLADPLLLENVKNAARKSRGQVKLSAGALPGIDGLAAAKQSGINTVALTSTKPPEALRGTPAAQTYNLRLLRCPTVVFEGSAREAALAYPKNANVAATVALAGIGFEDTQVTLIADPGAQVNSHRLEAAGAFGTLSIKVDNTPAPDNPKTSMMAALSILRLLNNETAALVI